MSVHLRKLTNDDIDQVEKFIELKMSNEITDIFIFDGFNNEKIFHLYMLPDTVIGYDKFIAFGYFDKNELKGIIGARTINQMSWVLSFIVTSHQSSEGIRVIRALIKTLTTHQELKGMIQWYVVSKGDRYLSWQRLFKHLRERYHHFLYAETPANEMPKWNQILSLTGGKLFPYKTTVSMYVSKSICTS
jgi:hypothetical protein